ILPPFATTILQKSIFRGSIQVSNPSFGLAPIEPESLAVSEIELPWKNSWQRIGTGKRKETVQVGSTSGLSFLYAKQNSVIYAVSGAMTLVGENRFRASKLTLLTQEDNLLAVVV